MSKRYLIPLLAALLAIGAFCWLRSPTGATNQLRFGAILPLTGNLAFLGESEAAALRVGIDEINSGPSGWRVDLILEDSRSEARSAVAAARKLIDIDKVHAAMVSTSALANAVVPPFRDAGVPLFTICSDDKIPQLYDRAVNIYTNLDAEQEVMAKYLADQRISRLSVIRVNAQITQRGIELLRRMAGDSLQIAAEETYELGAPDYRTQVSKALAAKPQGLYLMGYGVEFPALVRTIREVAPTVRVLGNYTFLSDPSRKAGTSLYDRIDFTSFTITPGGLASSDFGRRFSARLGRRAGPFMDYVFVYESVRAWAQLLTEGAPSSETTRRMRNRSFETLFGPMRIDKTGNAVVSMAIATYGAEGDPVIQWKPQ